MLDSVNIDHIEYLAHAEDERHTAEKWDEVAKALAHFHQINGEFEIDSPYWRQALEHLLAAYEEMLQ